MSRTHAPELALAVLDRLADHAAAFRDDFNRSRRARWRGVRLRDLLQDGDRKSVEPMAARAIVAGDFNGNGAYTTPQLRHRPP